MSIRVEDEKRQSDSPARVVALFGLLLLWAGVAQAELAVGSVVAYSDGKVERYLGEQDGKLIWEDDRKRRYAKSKNPVVPVLERTSLVSGKGYRQAISSGNPSAIEKLGIGQLVEFTVTRVRHDGRRSERRWECQRTGNSMASVLGIDRRVEQYRCIRFIVHRKFWHKVVKERLEFAYSRELGMVVEQQRWYRDKTRTREVVAILSPTQASYKRLSKLVRDLRKD